jgi:hypothetical protein
MDLTIAGGLVIDQQTTARCGKKSRLAFFTLAFCPFSVFFHAKFDDAKY